MKGAIPGYGTQGGSENMQDTWSIPGPPYWMIARYDSRGLCALTVERDGERALPIFSLEEEAWAFRSSVFGSEAGEGSWRVRQTGPGELLSILHGPCADVKLVTLDPDPEMELDFMRVGRNSFVDFLLGRGRCWFDERRDREKRERRSSQTASAR